MQYNVAQLLKEPTGGVRRYSVTEDIADLDPELAILGPLVGQLQLLRTNSGILVTGELSTAVQAVCSRCSEPIALPVRLFLTESFRPLTEVETGRYLRPDEFEGKEEDLEDEALLISEQHILDIREIVRQNIWLAIPMFPGCNWQGSGECPNLVNALQGLGDTQLLRQDDPNVTTDEIDPRWAALLELRSHRDEERRK
jgi:uncharacterized protein